MSRSPRESGGSQVAEVELRDPMEREIGRPRAAWSCDDLVDFAARSGVRLVSLIHVGGDGWIKALDFVPRDPTHLRDILEGGERADGSSLFPGSGIPAGASDVVLRPRPETAFLDPFAERPTLAVRCGHLGRDGRPLPQSPDTILRAACARLHAELGLELTALGEIEYFLGKPHDPDDIYAARERGYHAAAPQVFGQDLRRKAMDALAVMGVPVKYGHGEVGYIESAEAGGLHWEQHEIELALQPLPDAADAVAMTQWVLRLLAHREGLRCSFEPLIRAGHAGNGLHVHLSVREGARHLPVLEPDGALTASARLLVAGLVRRGGALMTFGNRVPSSFARLSQAKEAPGAVRWGLHDRSALVRIPIVPSGASGRPVAEPTIEFRLPDGSAIAHLLLAGIAQAMIAARDEPDLDALIAATATPGRIESAAEVDLLPRDTIGVDEALRRHRGVLEAGGVFPAGMFDGGAGLSSRRATDRHES